MLRKVKDWSGILILAGILVVEFCSSLVAQEKLWNPLFGMKSNMHYPDYIYPKTKLTMKEDAIKRGISVWTVVVSWNDYEPEMGKYNQEYIATKKKEIKELLKLGYKVEIQFDFVGVGVMPEWLMKIPHAKYKNQFEEEFDEKFKHWDLYPVKYPNVTFNPQIRQKMSNAIARFFKDISEYKDKIYAVYTTLTGEGDSVFPWLPDDDTNSWWAFDENAQSQTSPGSLAGPCPVPGWKPGDKSPNNEAEKFYNWYVESAVKVFEWQIQEIRKHFNGKIKLCSDIVWNHKNVTDEDVKEVISTSLNGTAPNEIWRLAAGYSEKYAEVLSKYPNVIPHHTAINEVTPEEVKFIKKYFNYLSGENAAAPSEQALKELDLKNLLDDSFKNIKDFQINEFRMIDDIILYQYRNPSPEYYEKKIKEFSKKK